MEKKILKLCTVSSLILLLLITGQTFRSVYGENEVNVLIEGTGKGKSFSLNQYWRWAGETILKIDGEEYIAYCIEPEVEISPGLYVMQTEEVPDNSSWRSISYILTWHHPAIDDYTAAEIQGAIWEYLNTNPSPFGSSFYDEALGKDVIRPRDNLTLTSSEDEVFIGDTVTLTARVIDADGNPRPGVRILFNTTIGTLDATEGTTNANGEVSVNLTATDPGEAKVTAWTKGIWVNQYLTSPEVQDLIIVGYTTTLTATSEVTFTTFVIPEATFGTLGMLASLIAALTLFIAHKRTILRKSQK